MFTTLAQKQKKVLHVHSLIPRSGTHTCVHHTEGPGTRLVTPTAESGVTNDFNTMTLSYERLNSRDETILSWQFLHVPSLRIHHHYVTYCWPYVMNVILLTCQESNTKVFVTLTQREKKAEIIPFPGPSPNCKHQSPNHLATSDC